MPSFGSNQKIPTEKDSFQSHKVLEDNLRLQQECQNLKNEIEELKKIVYNKNEYNYSYESEENQNQNYEEFLNEINHLRSQISKMQQQFLDENYVKANLKETIETQVI